MADTSYTPNESAELPFSLEAEQTIQILIMVAILALLQMKVGDER